MIKTKTPYIVGSDGKKLRKTKTQKAVVCKSDDGDCWEPVKPYNVDDWLRSEDVMGDMMAGNIVSLEETGPFYRVRTFH